MVNLWRDNEEHSKSVEEQLIGHDEDAEVTHDEETEDQDEEDIIPNFGIADNNRHPGGLYSDYEYENEMKFYKLRIPKI